MTKKTTSKHNEIAKRYFSARVLRKLTKIGVEIQGVTLAPGDDGSYLNGETCFQLNDSGTGRVRTYLGVLALVD